jgi:hypothetical protein
MKRRRNFLATAAAAVALLSLGAFVAITKASPPSGVTSHPSQARSAASSTLLARTVTSEA